MKKFLNIALLPVAALFLFSCEPAELEYTEDSYFDDIYTINKHTVSPEFSDTMIAVSNMDSYNLKTGDRARMVVRRYFDSQTTPRPIVTIHSLQEIIETYSMSPADSITSLEYNTPFSHLYTYDVGGRELEHIWVWNNRLNVNISYFGTKDNASFAMTVRGVKGDTIMFDLYAKAPRNGKATTTKLLTFDLLSAGDLLSAEQKESISGFETLNSKIYFLREVNDTIKEAFLTRARFANPYK